MASFCLTQLPDPGDWKKRNETRPENAPTRLPRAEGCALHRLTLDWVPFIEESFKTMATTQHFTGFQTVLECFFLGHLLNSDWSRAQNGCLG